MKLFSYDKLLKVCKIRVLFSLNFNWYVSLIWEVKLLQKIIFIYDQNIILKFWIYLSGYGFPELDGG